MDCLRFFLALDFMVSWFHGFMGEIVGDMALSQWLYISKVVGPVCLDDLLAIQGAAIRNNPRQNITGLLLHCQGHFVQFLEGDHRNVQELCDRLLEDRRHTNIELLYSRPAFRRYFEPWHMAMLDLDLHGDAERADFWELVQAARDKVIEADHGPRDLLILDRFAAFLNADLS